MCLFEEKKGFGVNDEGIQLSVTCQKGVYDSHHPSSLCMSPSVLVAQLMLHILQIFLCITLKGKEAFHV